MTALPFYTRAGYLNLLPYFQVLEYLTAAQQTPDKLWQQPGVRNLSIEILAALDLIVAADLVGHRQLFTITPAGTQLLQHTRRHRNT